MEQANSANFTIAALLGSARPQQELVRDAAVFQNSLHGGERGSLRCMMESDEEDEQESRLQGKAKFCTDRCFSGTVATSVEANVHLKNLFISFLFILETVRPNDYYYGCVIEQIFQLRIWTEQRRFLLSLKGYVYEALFLSAVIIRIFNV